MTPSRQTVAIVALCALLVVELALLLTGAWERHADDALLANLAAERREREAAVASLQEQLAHYNSPRSNAGGLSPTLPSPPTPHKAAEPPRPRSQSEIIANAPHLQLIELDRQRAAINQEYRRFFSQIGLSAEQIARFRENTMRWRETFMDLREVAREQDEPGRTAAAALEAAAKADYEAAQAVLLGPGGLQRLEEYEHTIPAYNIVVRAIAGAAAVEGIPLTREQGERLLAATVSASRGTTEQGYVDLQAMDWDALDSQARQILTAGQLSLFVDVQTPSGFKSPSSYQLEAAIQRAVESERKASAAPGSAR